MEKVIFEDDMKEFRRRCIVLLVLAVLLTVTIVATGLSRPEIEMNDASVLFVIFGVLLCYIIYCFVYISIYKVTATATTLNVRSLFGKKSLTLEKGLSYTRQNLVSQYRLYKIFVGSNKITVRTKKTEQFERLLLKFVEYTEEEPTKGGEEPDQASETTAENALPQSENTEKTQVAENKGNGADK